MPVDHVTAAVAAKLLLGNGMYIADDTSGNIAIFTSTGAKVATISSGNVSLLVNTAYSGIISNYQNINTAGVGVPPIYAAGAKTLYTNAAPTLLTYTPPATAGVYRLTGQLNALTAGTMTFKVIIGYTDAGGSARTDVPAFYRQNTTALIAGGMTANTADRYIMFPFTFSIDNSATAITIGDNSGTYTAGTYYWTPILEQLA